MKSVAVSVRLVLVLAFTSAAVLMPGLDSPGQARGLGADGTLTTSFGSAMAAPASRSTLKPKGETESGLAVRRVVDGDTLIVGTSSGDVTVRMIGINAPESVKPNSPIECFGPESSAFATSALTGRTVTLEFDPSQGRTDQYGRTLAYVWTERPDGRVRMFNISAIAQGFARERQYGPARYAWKSAFRSAQKTARRAHAGLWGACG